MVENDSSVGVAPPNSRSDWAANFSRWQLKRRSARRREWKSESLQQFLSVLRVRLAAALSSYEASVPPSKAKLAERVTSLIEADNVDWRDAFQAELYLVFLLTGGFLDEEIRQKLLESEVRGIAGTAERRALLLELASFDPK